MSDIEVGRLKVTADTSGVDELKEKLADLKDGVPSTGQVIDKLVESFKNIPGPVGAAVVGFGALGAAVGEMIAHTLEANQQLLELSEATGISVENLQPLIAGMEMAGVSSDKLGMAVGKLSQAAGQALSNPVGQAANAFKQLGISQDELKSGDTEQIMKDAAAGFAKYGDSIEKTAAERELFGKQGPQIVAALQAEAQYAAMVTQAQQDYGTAITKADAESDRYFTSTLSLGMTMFNGVAQTVTRNLLPGLQELVNQFADSGKQGGFMRDILDGLGATITVVAKVILSGLVEPVRFIALGFKEAGTTIGAFGAAVAAVAHGDLAGAKSIMSDLSEQIKQMDADATAAAAKFESSLWSGAKQPIEDTGNAADSAKPKFEAYSQAAVKITQELEKMRAELAAQQSVASAAAQGLDAYKAAQDAVAVATLRTQLAQEGASKAQIDSAVAMKQATDAAKQMTTDEVAGWKIINDLVAQNIGLTTHQTELQKQLAEIAAAPGMTAEEKSVASALAESNAQYKQQLELKNEINQMTQLASNDEAKEKAALTLSADALKEFNQQAALRKQYLADIQKDPANEQALTAAYQQTSAAITKNNQDIVQFQQSAAGAMAGASQATKNFAEQATNANQIINNLTSQVENGFSNAIVSAMNGGKDAFQQFALQAIKQIELIIVKLLVMKAVQASTAFLASGGTVGGSSTTLARGGAMTYAASGIVTSASMVAPNVIAGEQGNSTGEAILPLIRTADGSLGVNTSGGGGGGTSVGAINHVYQINVNAQGSQNPQQVAQQIAAQVKQIQQVSAGVLANNLRTGGMLNPTSVAAF